MATKKRGAVYSILRKRWRGENIPHLHLGFIWLLRGKTKLYRFLSLIIPVGDFVDFNGLVKVKLIQVEHNVS